jgi:hypothetical protein
MFNRGFWRDAFERAFRNAATSFAAMIAGQATMFNFGWEALIGVPLTAAALEIATSMSSVNLGARGAAGIAPAPEEANEAH